MKVISGEQTYQLIKQIKPKQKVIVTTGYAKSAIEHILQQGANDFLQKPFSSRTISEKIQQLINQDKKK